MMKFFESIRWRVQAWYSLLLILLVVGFGVFFYMHEKEALVADVDRELLGKLPLLFPRVTFNGGPGMHRGPDRPRGPKPQHGAGEFEGGRGPGGPPRGHGPPPHRKGSPDGGFGGGPPRHGDEMADGRKMTPAHPKDELELAFKDSPYFYAAWQSADKAPIVSDNAPEGLQPIENLEVHGGVEVHSRNGFREAFDATPELMCIIVGVDLGYIDSQLSDLAWHIAGICFVVVFSLLLVGWLLTGVVVKPFQLMKNTASQVASGDLEARIPDDVNQGETGELATTLNHTFDQLEQSFDNQRQFTADASHELRTPITALLLQVQMATRKDRSKEEYKTLFVSCERNVKLLKRLSDELLDLSALDAGGFALDTESHSLSEVVDEALVLMAPLMHERDVELQTHLDDISVQVDKGRLVRVVMNLVNNAIIHSPRGVHLDVSILKKGDWAQILIKDDGPGISSEQLTTLFQRFSRGDQSRAKCRDSTGLGLAISKSIIEQHHGKIEISSVEGQGTKVTVSLPL